MMDVLFTYLVVNLPSDLQVGSFAAGAKTMVAFEEYLFRKTMLVDVTLDYFKQCPVAACETGASETDNDLSPMIHLYC